MKWIKRIFCLHKWEIFSRRTKISSLDDELNKLNKVTILMGLYGESKNYWHCCKCGKIKAVNVLDIPISYIGGE